MFENTFPLTYLSFPLLPYPTSLNFLYFPSPHFPSLTSIYFPSNHIPPIRLFSFHLFFLPSLILFPLTHPNFVSPHFPYFTTHHSPRILSSNYPYVPNEFPLLSLLLSHFPYFRPLTSPTLILLKYRTLISTTPPSHTIHATPHIYPTSDPPISPTFPPVTSSHLPPSHCSYFPSTHFPYFSYYSCLISPNSSPSLSLLLHTSFSIHSLSSNPIPLS